jgi:hypothetical protein
MVVGITMHLGEYSPVDKVVVVGCEHGAHGRDTPISAITGQMKSSFYRRWEAAVTGGDDGR